MKRRRFLISVGIVASMMSVSAICSLTPEQAVDAGLNWLRTEQESDGRWHYELVTIEDYDVALTGMAALAFINRLGNDLGTGSLADEDVRNAINYILNHQITDVADPAYGAFGFPLDVAGDHRYVYQTSCAMWPLVALKALYTAADWNAYYPAQIVKDYNGLIDAIENGALYLHSCQWLNVLNNDWRYGGFGYEKGSRPDLSNHQFAVLALRLAHRVLPGGLNEWPANRKDAAAIFTSRCQNSALNPWLHFCNDGGFIYRPGFPEYAGGASYGSITAAGIWALYCSDIGIGDPRVDAGIDWLVTQPWYQDSLGVNPVFGDWMYYYYVMTVMKAFTMLAQDDVLPATWYTKWYNDFSTKLIALQTDGHWEGTNPGWTETASLATPYAILGLETWGIPLPYTGVIIFELSSPANLLVINPEGKRVGYDPETGRVVNEIPGAYYSGLGTHPEVITIPAPIVLGKYITKVYGTETGWYTLKIASYLDETELPFETYKGWIEAGAVDEWSSVVATVYWPMTVETNFPPFPPEYAVTISPTEQAKVGSPGDTVSYTFTIRNTGYEGDSYSLTCYGNIWHTIICDTTGIPIINTGVIPTHQSKNIIVKVVAPAVDGVIDLARIKVISDSAPSVCAEAGITTTTIGFSGHITQNTVWDRDMVISGDVIVDSGITLSIASGVTVYFMPTQDDMKSGADTTRCEIIVQGILKALGSEADSVKFTSASTNPTGGDWYGIVLSGSGADSSIIENAVVEYGMRGISCESSSPLIQNSLIRENYNPDDPTCGGGIWCNYSQATISGNTIIDNAPLPLQLRSGQAPPPPPGQELTQDIPAFSGYRQPIDRISNLSTRLKTGRPVSPIRSPLSLRLKQNRIDKVAPALPTVGKAFKDDKWGNKINNGMGECYSPLQEAVLKKEMLKRVQHDIVRGEYPATAGQVKWFGTEDSTGFFNSIFGRFSHRDTTPIPWSDSICWSDSIDIPDPVQYLDSLPDSTDAGIACWNSSPTITNNYILRNGIVGISLVSCSSSTIRDNTANNHVYGILLESSSNNEIPGNTANDNIGEGDASGIRLFSSAGNDITGNSVSGNENGITLEFGSTDNTVTNNTANNNFRGITLYEGNSHNIIRNNNADSNSWGIWLVFSSNENEVSNNTANSNTDYGIVVEIADSNEVTNNTANLNKMGVIFSSTIQGGNTLTGNTANYNTEHGIFLIDEANNNIVMNNEANYNGLSGITLQHSSNNNTLANNEANYNIFGTFLEGSSGNTLTHNIITENNTGVHLASGSANLGNLENADTTDDGNNKIYDNISWNVYNATPDTVMAQNNYWRLTDPIDIDRTIYDDDENPTCGPVIFEPILFYASVDIEPNTFNKKRHGKWITDYIELPKPFVPDSIVLSTVSLNTALGRVLAELFPSGIGDYDNDNIPDLMVKFNSDSVNKILAAGDSVEVTVTGKIRGCTFMGIDIIKVISPGKGGPQSDEFPSRIPKVFGLSPSYPNPFTQFTVINYQLPLKSKVSLEICDVSGRVVRTLANGDKEPGYYTAELDAKGLAGGVYFAKFRADNYKSIKKLILMK